MAVKLLTGNEAKSESTKSGVNIINIFGTWCGPCKMFAPILEELSSKVNVIKVDVDENNAYAQEHKIQGVPTTLIYKNGQLKDTIVGFVPLTEIEKKIESVE